MSVTAFSIMVSVSLTLTHLLLYPFAVGIVEEILWPTMVVAACVPAIMTPPLALVFQSKRLRLAEAHMQLQEANRLLQEQARTDTLTGLLNRRGFLACVEARRETNPAAAMLMIDADHFKSINDRFGHHQGDRALVLIAGALKSSLRDGDLAARIGGEEFAIYVETRDSVMAKRLAERVRATVAGLRFEPAPGQYWPLRVSIGAAVAAETDTLDDLLQQADHSMYEAKQEGRDRVIISTAA